MPKHGFRRHPALLIILIFMSGLMDPDPAMAQKKRKKRKTEQAAVQVENFADSEFFRFPNVNKVPYYQKASQVRKIRQLERQERWDELYPILREYVASFGIMNFYRDTDLIWRLARLTEMYGNRDEAILLYKLVLKHHRDDIDVRQVMAEFGDLSQESTDQYASLNYYYDLVNARNEVDTLVPPPGYMINMGKDINSDADDYAPSLNADDNVMLFTSKRNEVLRDLEYVENEDLFYSVKVNDFFTEARPMEGINTEFNEGSACLSRDGKTLYFSRCDAPDGYGDCDIYTATLQEDSTWSNVTNLGVRVNSNAWDSHPSLSHTNDTLFFASDRIGGFGLVDIYFTYRDEDGEWVRALNAGPIINTRNSEVSPFYHHEFNVLYFSSNGQNLNFGSYDIYKAYWQGSNWGEPRNVGPIINGPGAEYYFTIDSESEFLFYARAKEKMENLDLYSFPLPMGAQPGAVVAYMGYVGEDEGPYMGIVSIIDMETGIEVAPKIINSDGTFSFDLINNKNYLIVVQGENYLDFEELFYLQGDTEINARPQPINTTFKFESITFDEGSAELKPEMFIDIDRVAQFLAYNPGFKLRISGHTDSGGSEEYNLELSQQRADMIKEYMVYFGSVEPDRIEARGYGSSQPLVEETTEEDKALNRRVEFELYRN